MTLPPCVEQENAEFEGEWMHSQSGPSDPVSDGLRNHGTKFDFSTEKNCRCWKSEIQNNTGNTHRLGNISGNGNKN